MGETTMQRLLACLLLTTACSESKGAITATAQKAAASEDGKDEGTDALADSKPASTDALSQLMTCPAGDFLQSTGNGWQCTPPPELPSGSVTIVQSSGSTEKLAQVVRVAKSGGDFTTIQEAITSIKDEDSRTRYVVRVAPGRYAESVTMKPFVDIEGAGEGITTIAGAVEGAEGVSLRNLSVQAAPLALHTAHSMTLQRVALDSSSTKGDATALSVSDGAAVTASHASFSASGSNPKAVSAASASLSLSDVEIKIAGTSRGTLVTMSLTNTKTSLKHAAVSVSGGTTCSAISIDGASPIEMAYVTLDVSSCTSQAIALQTGADVAADIRHSRIGVAGGVLRTAAMELGGTASVFSSQIRVSASNGTVLGAETKGATRFSDTEIDVAGTGTTITGVNVFTSTTRIDRCRLTVPSDVPSPSVRAVITTARGAALMANTGTPDKIGFEGTVRCVYPYFTDSYTISGATNQQPTLFALQNCPLAPDQIP